MVEATAYVCVEDQPPKRMTMTTTTRTPDTVADDDMLYRSRSHAKNDKKVGNDPDRSPLLWDLGRSFLHQRQSHGHGWQPVVENYKDLSWASHEGPADNESDCQSRLLKANANRGKTVYPA